MIDQAPRPASPQPGIIRESGGDDMDAVMAIMGAAFEPTYGEAWTRSQCAGILPMAGVSLRLADRGDGTAVGFALVRTIADEAELLLIAVDPAVQHHGIGAALVDDFVALATAHGARRLHLEVRDGNAAMILYERAGFSLAGRRRDYYRGSDGHKRDALTLALER
ncbi:MAG: ribosomal protein S18-alanine N-acetyltransferase [Sphingomonas sp.]|nr:ribosomal protein S18-alanine N-acetyltransferase [Sphingomonas sp.]